MFGSTSGPNGADLDNMHKLILDALTGIVYSDDHQVDGAAPVSGYDPEKPRMEITVH
jgi:Holliday junction resolvase RusA-like endonuclease